ncbi:MAG: hypothetical protein Q8P18_19695 [Pseudomonadota bacterium]|nr:hypothetical protein [Pseudomonadota bacterium]
MIVRDTGVLRLADESIGPDSIFIDQRAPSGRNWRASGGGMWVREADDTRGRSLVVTACIPGGQLAWLELCYAIRRPAEGLEGARAWEAARKDYQDAIVREWFANSVHELMYAPPPQPGPLRFTFAWGSVSSDLRSDARGARIEVRYVGAAG